MKNKFHQIILWVAFFVAVPVSAQEPPLSFLEGFPDVPHLPVIRAIEGDLMIFDTPSGTIAEIKLLTKGSSSEAMQSYKAALTALGWACADKRLSMTCNREKDRLVFSDPESKTEKRQLILRLEPIK